MDSVRFGRDFELSGPGRLLSPEQPASPAAIPARRRSTLTHSVSTLATELDWSSAMPWSFGGSGIGGLHDAADSRALKADGGSFGGAGADGEWAGPRHNAAVNSDEPNSSITFADIDVGEAAEKLIDLTTSLISINNLTTRINTNASLNLLALELKNRRGTLSSAEAFDLIQLRTDGTLFGVRADISKHLKALEFYDRLGMLSEYSFKLGQIVGAPASERPRLYRELSGQIVGDLTGALLSRAGGGLALRALLLASPALAASMPFWATALVAAAGVTIAATVVDEIVQRIPSSWIKTMEDLWGRGIDSASDLVRDYLSDLWESATNLLVRIRTDPLVLDLDGDGSIELISREAANVYFDIDADGIQESVGWVAPDDGFLVLDRNGNGRIDDVNEMFGTLTRSGFDILSELDTNRDRFITSADSQFGQLRVWRDLNQNGVSEASELTSLSTQGIANIDLRAQDTRFTSEGNLITFKSLFTRTNGTTGLIADVWLAFSNIATPSVTAASSVANIPDLAAFGRLPTLRNQASVVQGLVTVASQAGAIRIETVDQLPGLVETLLLRWANVESVNPASRGQFYDARRLAFLEAYVGTAYALNGVPQAVPSAAAAASLDRVWNKIWSEAAIAILIQSDPRLGEAGLGYNPTTRFSGAEAPAEVLRSFAKLVEQHPSSRSLLWALGIAALDRIADTSLAEERTSYENALPATLATFGLDRFIAALRNPLFLSAHSGVLTHGDADELLIVGGVQPVTATLTAQGAGIVTGAGGDVLTTSPGFWSRGVYMSSGQGTDALYGSDGADVLDGGEGADWMEGRSGDDVYIVDSIDDVVIEQAQGGVDTVITEFDYRLAANLENLRLTGTRAVNGTGNDADNLIVGNAAANILTGGRGNDIYEVDASDLVIELAGGGTDRVRSLDAIVLQDNIEEGQLLGAADVSITGNELNNRLIGNAGKNVLRGGFGADTLEGGLGDDLYVIDARDSVVEAANGGVDTVFADFTISLVTGVEIGVLTGSGDWNVTGGDGWNLLVGNSGANRLDGGQGGDDLRGGAGDDTYLIDSFADLVTELANEGRDTVQFDFNAIILPTGMQRAAGGVPFSYRLAENVERLVVNVTSSNVAAGTPGWSGLLLGNATDNSLELIAREFGSTSPQPITFRLAGGAGNDTYVISGAGTSITWAVEEAAGEGTDTIIVDRSHQLGAHIENLTLTSQAQIASATGNSLNNRLIGNDWDNVLDGGAGADTMIGGRGSDTYVVADLGDVVEEDLNGGRDLVRASISYVLAENVEDLELLGSANLNGVGNDLANRMTGNAGLNILTGGLGDDVYVIGAGDVVVEARNGGRDTIISNVSAALFDEVEVLQLTGTGDLSGWGNDGDNRLEGNDGANYLDGGLGSDQYAGGRGNDVYIIDQAGDSVQESANEGIDTIISSISVSIGAHIERVLLSGSGDIDATSRDGAQYLRGNTGANRLDGGDGDDTLEGGRGNDTYVISSLGDQIIERWNDGIDTVITELASYTLAAGVERLELRGWNVAQNGTGNELDNEIIGTSAANVLTGGAGNDTLNGNGGADRLVGGLGDDVYLIDSADDVIVEAAGEGIDTVITNASYILSANIENATLVGFVAADLQGNGSANTLIGSDGNNNLDGGAGIDIMEGRGGNDTYNVDQALDRLIEGANGGRDTVRSTVTWVLDRNFENLVLLGVASIDAYGNDQDNEISGNGAANRIVGGLGSDTLTGLGGADTFVFAALDRASDTVTDFQVGAGGDVLDLSGVLRSIGYTGSNAIGDGVVRITGSGTTTWIDVNATRSATNPDWVRVVSLNNVTRSAFVDSINLRLTAASNLAPISLRPVGSADVRNGEQLRIRIDGDSFVDPEGGRLTLRAEWWNGATLSALPSWLSFNASERLLFGTAAGGAVGGTVRITATDDRGATAFQDLVVNVRRRTFSDTGGDGRGELILQSRDGGISVVGTPGTAAVAVGPSIPRSWSLLGRGDMNGDSRSDLVFRNTLTGSIAVWTMAGTTVERADVLAGNLDDRAFLTIADFDGDGASDILSLREGGQLDMWRFNRSGVASADVVVADDTVVVPRGMRFVGSGDVDGDGGADLVWRDASGVVSIWRMSSYTVLSQTRLSTQVPLAWNLLGLGDFNGDGRSELLWRNLESGDVVSWQTNGLATTSSVRYGALSQDWQFADIVDRDGDGRQDVVWRNVDGRIATWSMSSTGIAGVAFDAAIPGSEAMSSEPQRDQDVTRRLLSDFDGDGRADLIWRNAEGRVARWAMSDGRSFVPGDVGSVPHDWRLLAQADMNGDRRADLIWQNTRTGDVAGWTMSGNTQTSAAILAQGLARGTELQAVADLTGDGQAELIWRERSGGVRIWSMNNGAIASVTDAVQVPWGFDLLGAADFNGDGSAEILWRGPSNEILMWSMNGTALAGVATVSPGVSQAWSFVAAADFDGDRRADILWRNRDSGNLAIWRMNGAAQAEARVIAAPKEWAIDGVGDVSGDGRADIVWRQASTGLVATWRMNGFEVAEATVISSVPPPATWQLLSRQALFGAA